MFIKTNENKWINLSMCKQVDIRQTDEKKYNIVFLFVNVGPDAEFNSSIGPFDTEIEAQELLDIIWKAHREKVSVWAPEPEVIMKVTIPDMDYSTWNTRDWNLIEIFLEVISTLDIKKVKELGVTVDGCPFITDKRDYRRAQRQYSNYYVTSGIDTMTMKRILQDIAKKLDMEININISYLG